jgi:hypothetical protein
MARSPRPTASTCACPTSPIPPPASASTADQRGIDYIDMHLSHVAQHAWFGFFGKLTTP